MNRKNGTPPVVVLLERRNCAYELIRTHDILVWGQHNSQVPQSKYMKRKPKPSIDKRPDADDWKHLHSTIWKLHSWIEFLLKERKKERKEVKTKTVLKGTTCLQFYLLLIFASVLYIIAISIDWFWFKRSDLMVECNFIAQKHSMLA